MLLISSSEHRAYRCLDKIVVKYDLNLVAGNFFYTEYDKCIDAAVAKLDPSPPYIEAAYDKVDLPATPSRSNLEGVHNSQ